MAPGRLFGGCSDVLVLLLVRCRRLLCLVLDLEALLVLRWMVLRVDKKVLMLEV